MAEQNPPGRKFSPDDVQKHVKKVQELVEKHRREKKEEHFTAITPEEVERKLNRVDSPFITSMSWGSGSPGGTITYSVWIYNPDPTTAGAVFAHVWVGSGNVDPTVGTFLLNVDARFPRLTEPAMPGLSIPTGGSSALTFTINIPAGVEKSNYLGNCCVVQLNWHDTGKYLDRGVFPFKVS